MLNIKKQKLDIDSELKRKVDLICGFNNLKAVYKCGSINTIKNTNLSFVKPHTIIIKEIPILMFNGSNDIYIGNLYNKFKLSELDNILKAIKVFK